MDKGMEESILRPTCDARDQSLALGEAEGVDRDGARHTLGPWVLLPASFSLRTFVMAANACSDSPAIADVRDRYDARLIAAAPAMLDALRRVRDSSEWSCMERDTQDAVDIAIRSAAGRGEVGP